METLDIEYRFGFPDGRHQNYLLRLDPRTLDLVGHSPENLPSWTDREFHLCPHCPLTPETHSHCPAAVRLLPVLTNCNDLLSYQEIGLTVVTPERTIFGQSTAQRAVSSLMGLLMATSGCPHTAFFRPMARFHLPLATEEETIYRATSTYLLAQYFRSKEGEPADLALEGLASIYRDIHILNQSMAGRIRAACKEDSTINALIILDLFTKSIPFVIKDSLEEIRYLFTPFLRQRPEP